jgi:hypothetical protein
MPRPATTDSAPFYHQYIGLVKGDNVQAIIAENSQPIKEFYNNLPESKADYAYAEGKWIVKEVLQHLIDGERIFSYRALRFARKDPTPLTSFDENSYAENSMANKRTLESLKEEFSSLRISTDLLLKSFNDEQLASSGTASNHHITVNAIAFIIYGHLLHHKNILEERYLKS